MNECWTNFSGFFNLQKSCIDFTIGARPLERYMPSKRNSFKYKVWRIVVSTPFEYFIMMLIVFNTLLLMMKVCLISFIWNFLIFSGDLFTHFNSPDFYVISLKNFMHKFDLIMYNNLVEKLAKKNISKDTHTNIFIWYTCHWSSINENTKKLFDWIKNTIFFRFSKLAQKLGTHFFYNFNLCLF